MAKGTIYLVNQGKTAVMICKLYSTALGSTTILFLSIDRYTYSIGYGKLAYSECSVPSRNILISVCVHKHTKAHTHTHTVH